MRPEDVGVPQATLVLGKHSGRHAVQRRLEQIGVAGLERKQLDAIYAATMAHADREKIVSDTDLAAIAARITGARDASRPAHQPAAATPDFHTTPAEVGYGHGV